MKVHREIQQYMMHSNTCGKWIDSIWESIQSRDIVETAYRVCAHMCRTNGFLSNESRLCCRMAQECIAALGHRACYTKNRALVLNRDNFLHLVEVWARTIDTFVKDRTRATHSSVSDIR